MSEDNFDQDVLRSVKRFMDRAVAAVDSGDRSALSPLGEAIASHLGTDAATLPIVSETLADHRLVDADIALGKLAGDDPDSLIGVSGGAAAVPLNDVRVARQPICSLRPGTR